MKKLLSILIMLVSLSAAAQVQNSLPSGSVPYGTQYYISPDGNIWVGTSTKKFRAVGPKHRVDSLLALKQGALTLTTDSTSGAATLIGNTLNIPQYTGGGGGGGITGVTSANTDIGVADGTTAPILTVNSGLGANQIVKRNSSGYIPVAGSTTHIGSFGGASMFFGASAFNMYTLNTTTAAINGHIFNGDITSFTLFPQQTFPGNFTIYPLRTGVTAPATTGTTKMMVVDGNGLVSSAAIPTGGGTLTNFSKVDGLGIISAVTNPTTTPQYASTVDTTVIVHKNYAKARYPVILKDFYTDSAAVGTSLTNVYRYLMPANTLTKNGDKVACTYYINQGSATFPTIEIKVNGSTLTSYIFDAGEITNLTVRTVIFRVSSTILKVAIEMDGATFGVYTVDPITLSNPVLIGVGLQKASGSLTAKAGFIQFIPAAP